MPEQLYQEVIDAFEALFGKHPGFRRAHAKGVVCKRTFVPASTAVDFCRAPHLQGPPVPVTVRFSNFTGLPELPDNDPQSNPRGMAIRFQASGAAATTDLVAHSYNGFPTSTVEELSEFLRTLAASGPTAPDPKPIAKFLEEPSGGGEVCPGAEARAGQLRDRKLLRCERVSIYQSRRRTAVWAFTNPSRRAGAPSQCRRGCLAIA